MPNVVFDTILPHLKGAEVKVLLIIIRQTLGWKDSTARLGRKEQDWISGTQLQRKTGLSRRAISIAIDQLVKRELIEVSDGINALYESTERRGKVKLYFRLFPVLGCHLNPLGIRSAKSDLEDTTYAHSAQDLRRNIRCLSQKMRITKINSYKNNSDKSQRETFFGIP